MRLVFSIIIFFVILLFFIPKNDDEKQKELMQRGEIILNVLIQYKSITGKYPEDLSCCFSNLKVTDKEMYLFPFDKGNELAFIYEFDVAAGEYILVIGDRYPPNLIFFTKTGEFIFNSDLILKNGL